MYAEIKAAVDSFKVILNIASASKDFRNFNELSAAVSEVNGKLSIALTAVLAGQEKQAALSERVRQLEAELMQCKNFEAESENYVLQEVGMGTFARVYKPVVQTKQPRHWACAHCFDNHHRSILQYWKQYSYKCPHCGATIEASKNGHFVTIDDAYKTSQ